MKIAYLVNQYPHVRHTFIRREILALERLGVQVERFSLRRVDAIVGPEDFEERRRTQVLLDRGWYGLIPATLATSLRHPWRGARAFAAALRLGWRSRRGVHRHLVYFAEACAFVRASRRLGVDHAHVHFGTNSATVALLSYLLGGPTYSLTIHGPEEWDRPEDLSLSSKYEKAMFIAAVSDYGRCQVLRWCPQDRWRDVHRVRCGVDEMFLNTRKTPVPDVPLFVNVGGLVAEKGQVILLDALRLLAERGVVCRVDILGDGPLRCFLETRANELGVKEQVRFLGWQSSGDVREAINGARALVVASFAENLPVVLMEALALRRPVIGTQLAGIPELVEPGCGWLVPPGSASALANAMEAVLKTPVTRLNEMGCAGARRVRELHDSQREAQRLWNLLCCKPAFIDSMPALRS